MDGLVIDNQKTIYQVIRAIDLIKIDVPEKNVN